MARRCGILLLGAAVACTALQLHLDTPEFTAENGAQRVSAVLSLQRYDSKVKHTACFIAYRFEAENSWRRSDKNEQEMLLRLSLSELAWRLTATIPQQPFAVRAECDESSGVTVTSNVHSLHPVARRASTIPVIQSIIITGSAPNVGSMGESAPTFEMTVDNLGPDTGTPPSVAIAGFPCTNVVRTGPSTVTARAPPGVGGGFTITVTVGSDTSSTVGAPTFNYPRPDVTTVDILTFTEWSNLAGPILQTTPRTLKDSATLVSPAGSRPRGSTLDVRNVGDVVLLKGANFGPWVGNGTFSESLGANVYWATYEISLAQCIATPWPGRATDAPPPTCNRQWDYPTEGELPNPGTILYWSDTLVAFRVPPACPGLREVIISTGGVPGIAPLVVTSMSGRGVWEVDMLLRYGGAQFRVDTVTGPLNDVSTRGTTTLTLTGPAFALSSSCAVSGTFTMPASYSASLTVSPPAWAMQVVHIANVDATGTVVPQGMDVCAQATWSAQSPFAQSSFLSGPPAVPASCQVADPPQTNNWVGWRRVEIIYGAGGTAHFTIPPANGANIRMMPYVYDVVRTSTGVNVQRWSTNGNATSTNTPLVFSYSTPTFSPVDCGSGAWPSMCLTRRLFSVVTPGTFQQTNFELFIRAQNIGSEEVGGCSTGGGAFMTVGVAFEPFNSTYARFPGGDDKLVTSDPRGGFLPKQFTGGIDCSQVVGTSGYIPTMAVGRYGLALSVTSPAGTRVGRLSSADGVAYTCGPGNYGKLGQICAACLTSTIGNCPGGPTALVAGQLPSDAALEAPIRAAAGLYNYDGPRAAACPPNTPTANRPAGRDVCIAPCTPRAACAGGNACNAGYEDVPGVWGCSKCAATHARVIALVSTCGASSPLLTVNGTCASATDCTAVGGLVNAPLPGGNGENVCSCVPAPSATPSTSRSAAPGTATSTATGTASASVAAASTSGTPTPTVPANTCSNGVLNTGETDVDCGGACPRCSLGNRCRVSGDCSAIGTDAVCSSSSSLCTDVRAGAGFWLDTVSTYTVKHTVAQLAVMFRFNFTLPNSASGASMSDIALSSTGLDILSRGIATAVRTRLESAAVPGGSPWVTPSTVRVYGTVSQVIRMGSQTRPSPQARRLNAATTVFTQNASVSVLIVLSPTTTATADWATEVRDAVTQGALDTASMVAGMTTALSNSPTWTAILQSQPSGSPFLTVPPARSNSAAALPPVVSVEAAAAPPAAPAGPAPGAAIGGAIIGVLIAACAGFVFYVLRTHGEFAGCRLRYFATCCGMWPLHPKVMAQVRMRRPQKKAKTTTTAESYLGGKSLTSIPLVIPSDAAVTPQQKKVQMNPIGVATQSSQRVLQGASSPQRGIPAGTMNVSARQIGSSRQLNTTGASGRSLTSSAGGQRSGGLSTSPSHRAAAVGGGASSRQSFQPGTSQRGGSGGTRGGSRV